MKLTVTIKEACAISGLSRSKLYLLMGEGKLDTKTVGSRRLVKMNSLRALLGWDNGGPLEIPAYDDEVSSEQIEAIYELARSGGSRDDISLVERATRAIEGELARQHDEDRLTMYLPRAPRSRHVSVSGGIDLKSLTTAILTAIRDPDTRMSEEGDAFMAPNCWSSDDVWKAMIDAALDRDR